MSIRLVRYLALAGVASRRAAAEIVRAGRVSVNGQTTTNVALGVEPDNLVTVDGREISLPDRATVVLLNKPAGQVCSLSDPHNPSTVMDNFSPDLRRRLKPVGRLDRETTGVLLLTDDGELAFRLTHPSYGVEKTYRARVRGQVSTGAAVRLRQGVPLEDGVSAPAQVRIRRRNRSTTILDLTIHEGRKHLVRRMCEAVGYPVRDLCRIRFGPLRLGDLAPGEFRTLGASEIQTLRRCCGLERKTRDS